jgi:hypothetical protein
MKLATHYEAVAANMKQKPKNTRNWRKAAEAARQMSAAHTEIAKQDANRNAPQYQRPECMEFGKYIGAKSCVSVTSNNAGLEKQPETAH